MKNFDIVKAETEAVQINPEGWVVKGSFNPNEAFGITTEKKEPTNFLTDLVSWATFFIWAIVSIALIYSALLLIFGWGDEKQIARGKDGIKYSLIGLVLVIFSYTIVKIIQYVGTH